VGEVRLEHWEQRGDADAGRDVDLAGWVLRFPVEVEAAGWTAGVEDAAFTAGFVQPLGGG
jgi:hypothetical protein